MLDYIFLDLDGPLLDGKIKHFKLYEKLIIEGNGTPVRIDEYWNMKRNKINRKVLLEHSKYQLNYETFLNGWLNHIEQENFLKLDKLKPNVKEVLSSWKKFTHKIVLVTMRHNYRNLMKQLNDTGLLHLLDDVIMCDARENITKYDMVKHIVFSKAVFIGDTEEDIETSIKLNIPSVGIVNGLRDKKHLKAEYLFNEINEIDVEIFRGI